MSDIPSSNETDANIEKIKCLKRKNASSKFPSKRSISSRVFEYISRCTSTSSIWKTLDNLYNKKNEARLQMLDTDLENVK